MRDDQGVRVRRVPVSTDPLRDDHSYDYADAFELQLADPDDHSAEQWVRTALERGGLRRLILLVHRHILRFELGPDDTDHILGWRIVSSTHAVLHLATQGALGRGVILARRTSSTSSTLTTFVSFDSVAGPRIWSLVGPLHRRVAPYLLKQAARTFSRGRAVRPAP